MSALKEINKTENYLDLLTQIAPVTMLLQKQKKKSHAKPIFDLKEYDACYILSIDLPSLKTDEMGIEVSKERLQLVEDRGDSASILFQCEATGKRVKAYYQDGILRVVLPKNSLTDILDLPRLAKVLS